MPRITPSLIQNAPSGAVMSDEDDADCAFSMRKGVKHMYRFHRKGGVRGDSVPHIGSYCHNEMHP